MIGINMEVNSWLLVCIWFLLHGYCLSRFVVEKNSLKVTSPESLKDVYECAIGNFGVPQYGGTVVGAVVYPKANQMACKSFEDVDISFKSKPGEMPTFLLVVRGDCFFTLKAWNAQKAGATAILVADDKVEPLITMDTPEEEDAQADYLQSISIPSVLISKSLGDKIKKELSKGEMVSVNLDWREALPHPDERVEYEFWTNSNDEFGPKCESQKEFVQNFKGAAQILEKKGYTLFTPRYITWYCPEPFILSKQCKSQCINHGRYCALGPEQGFSRGYDGKDVVLENLHQICFFKVANETGKPWLWWDYVSDFAMRCPMKDKKYTKECADQVVQALGIDVKQVEKCVGDPDADVDNPILKGEQGAQLGKGARGDVTILPTLVINNRQYRGKLDRGAVLKAICSGFQETTEPAICLSDDIETNECFENNGGCWQDKAANITACKDTFRGRVCECPVVRGTKFVGDGYTHCEASGALRCEVNNGGCWKGTKYGVTYSACNDGETKGCTCPPGFKGDGVKDCEDIDECKEKTACQCPECKCKNTWGSYECSCRNNLLYILEYDTRIGNAKRKFSWSFIWVMIFGLAAAGTVGYAFYKYRVRKVVPLNTWVLISNYKLAYNMLRRPDGTFNRDLAEFLDRKVPANTFPVDGVYSFDVVDRTTNLLNRVYRPAPEDVSQRGKIDLEKPLSSVDIVPVIIFFHGGSFAHSTANSALYDTLCRRLVNICKAAVVSVNYRRSPEYRYPCAYDDGWTALKWVHSRAWLKSGKDDSKVHVYMAGDSSGGNIIHHVAVRAAVEGVEVLGNILLQPLFGGVERTESEKRLDGKYFVRIQDRDWYWRAFLPEGENRDHPACNIFGPRSRSLQGLKMFPKSLVVVPGLDLLRDWQRAYVKGLEESGQEVKLLYMKEAIIGFYFLPNNDYFLNLMDEITSFIHPDRRF